MFSIKIGELINKLESEIVFRPEQGNFRSKLAEIVIDNGDEECEELFSKHNCDISVRIAKHTIEEGLLRFLCVSDLGEQWFDCEISALNHAEISDLEAQISQQITPPTLASSNDAPKIILRKNVNGMYNSHQAAQRIDCSQSYLKKNIPCSDYTYREHKGAKEICEYYWSKKLIDRICHVKLNGVKAEDIEYIAKECCHGDLKWAEDILVSLGYTNITPNASASLPYVINRSAKTKSNLYPGTSSCKSRKQKQKS